MHALRESAIELSQQNNLMQSTLMANELDKINTTLSEHWKRPGDIETDQCDQSRTNTIVHVCWQRNCTIISADYHYALTVRFIFVLVLGEKFIFFFTILNLFLYF